MLRTPLISKVAGRKLDLSTGDPTKDKLLMGGLIVVIIAAVGAMVWSLTRGDKGGGGDGVITKDVALICVNPKCSYTDDMNRQDYYQKLNDELTFEELHGMNPPRTACSDCNHPGKSVVQGIYCPNCRKGFVNPEVLFNVRRQLGFPAQPPAPKLMCPHCGTDVLAFRAEQGNKK